MKLRRRHLLVQGLASAIPLATPLRSARAAGVSDREIVLGTHLDLSGPASLVNPPLRNAIQMRIDEANENGGIHGRKLRLVIEDNGSQPALAARAVDKLLRKDGIFALVCPFGSGTNAATIKRVVDAETICFAPFGASAQLQAATGRSRFLFTTNPNYDTVVAAGVQWAMSTLGSRRIGLIYQDNQFGEQVGLGVRRALASAGVGADPVALAGYRVGDLDFSSHVARMRAAQADLIVCATVTRETLAVCNELHKLDDTQTAVMVAPPSRNSIVERLGGPSVNGLYGIGAWRVAATPATLAPSQAWTHRYFKRFGVGPEDTSHAFYGYADWFVQELERLGREVSTERLVQGLQRSTYEGLATYGKQRFVGNHVDPEWIQIDRMQSGRWAPLSAVINASKI